MYEPDLVQTLPAAGLTALKLDIVAGDIVLESADRSDIRILASGIRDNPRLMPALERNSDTLHIDGETELALALLHQQERIKLMIQIPVNMAVTVRILVGTIQLNGSFETLDARLRFGSISGCAPAQRLKLRVFAGDVRLGGLTGAADVQVSLGDLTMAWAHLNGGEAISARTFAGETALDLPDHMTLLDGRAVIEEDTVPVQAEATVLREAELSETAAFRPEAVIPAS